MKKFNKYNKPVLTLVMVYLGLVFPALGLLHHHQHNEESEFDRSQVIKYHNEHSQSEFLPEHAHVDGNPCEWCASISSPNAKLKKDPAHFRLFNLSVIPLREADFTRMHYYATGPRSPPFG